MQSQYLHLEAKYLQADGSFRAWLAEPMRLPEDQLHYVGVKEIFHPKRHLLTLRMDNYASVYRKGKSIGEPVQIPAGTYHWNEIDEIISKPTRGTAVWSPFIQKDDGNVVIRTTDKDEVLLFTRELAVLLGFNFWFEFVKGVAKNIDDVAKIQQSLNIERLNEDSSSRPLPEFLYRSTPSEKLPTSYPSVCVSTDIVYPQQLNQIYTSIIKILPCSTKKHWYLERPAFYEIDKKEIRSILITFTDLEEKPIEFHSDDYFIVVLEIKSTSKL